jgi:hypothetical protein
MAVIWLCLASGFGDGGGDVTTEIAVCGCDTRSDRFFFWLMAKISKAGCDDHGRFGGARACEPYGRAKKDGCSFRAGENPLPSRAPEECESCSPSKLGAGIHASCVRVCQFLFLNATHTQLQHFAGLLFLPGIGRVLAPSRGATGHTDRRDCAGARWQQTHLWASFVEMRLERHRVRVSSCATRVGHGQKYNLARDHGFESKSLFAFILGES